MRLSRVRSVFSLTLLGDVSLRFCEQSLTVKCSRSMSSVLHSHALDAKGHRQSINMVDAPRPFRCGDCGGEMVARRGRVRTWHFAHKAQVVCEPKADPDNALHRFAQDIICESFLCHQDEGTEYKVGVACAGVSMDTDGYGNSLPSCANPVAKNVALPDAKILKEHVLVPDTRSDLVIQLPDDKALIIEIVNTHAPEESTKELYRNSGYPVLIKKVSWESLDELAAEVITSNSLNVPTVRCASCNDKKRQEEKELALRKKLFQKRKLVIDAASQKLVRRRSQKLRFRPWYQVYKPSWGTDRPIPMYPKTQRQVFANAIILTELGFDQRNTSKPHLFSYQIRNNPRIVLYADLGGSDIIPIYEDTAAMLYVPDLQDDPDIEQYTIDRFGRVIRREGVNVRTGFESKAYIKQVNVNPLEHVPKAMLDSVVRWYNTCRACQTQSVYKGMCRQCGTVQDGPTIGLEDEYHDGILDIMTDYPGKPVRSARKWMRRDE